jgi:hypothetical protein
MAVKNPFDTTLDFSEHPLYRVGISTVHYTGVQGVGVKVSAEPAARAPALVRRPAALKALREHRQLFTADAVIDRAARLKTA